MKPSLLLITFLLTFRLPSFRSLRNQFYSESLRTKCEVQRSQLSMKSNLNGLLAIYKPRGWSSSYAVAQIKRVVQTVMSDKIKVGHGGTLDPLAEGVLVIGIGSGTKLLGKFLSGTKGYIAIGKLGEETDTLDGEGKVVAEKDCSNITLQDIENVLPHFRGSILQKPPMFSALSRNGTRLYKLARQGVEVEIEARTVEVSKLNLIHGVESLPLFRLEIECGGGFYVRSAISDIAKKCNGVAYMTYLQRIKQGPFELKDCLKEDDWAYENIAQKIKESSGKLIFNS